jgi:hypothetical protein
MNQQDLSRLAAAISRLHPHDHLCLIYETQEEQFAAVVPFVKAGLERREKCLYIVDDNTASAVLEAIRAGGVKVDSALQSGALVIFTKQDTYLKDGRFDPDRMICMLKAATDQARQEGYSALRVTGEMTWVLGGGPGVERLMEYEAKLNYFFPANSALAICQYNRMRFRPEVIIDVLSTHPLAIFGGLVCRNFYYMPPDEFLKPEQVSLRVERLLHNIVERAQAEAKLQERTVELEKRNAELETLLRGFTGQEVRMAELKEKIRKLELKHGN